MATVIWDVSMSLDGFIAGPGISTAYPMGRDDDGIHAWMSGGEPSHGVALVDRMHASTGAVIMGRRTFDVGIGPWGDVPLPAPCFVLTHRPRPPLTQTSGTFTFVTDDIAAALDRVINAAGDRTVLLMGGQTGRQYLTSGLVDELRIHIAPLLLGDGRRLYEHEHGHLIPLHHASTASTPDAVHIRYGIAKPPSA